ncbi:MAG: glycosyltransferase [Phycisphaerae bacterium]|nr:glycosyltransferase family 4 protein [Phycisphaerae bacterium]NIP56044.1 glycosyltransferase family 4 protein [Phycisphaerae bacterium]NIS50314.1 glycosyltransferase family 4 protein [Phycisphaerae bacterium]NIU08061.1 glycosyltransferase family 4 protein [Phycisphaerae bacterium]NIU59960.1 glycosyltransferase [Phycisphaerae bacterium]
MAEQPEFTLHFLTNSPLSAETANSVAKIEMAKAFCKQNQVKKLCFYLVIENREKLESLNLNNISKKLIIKPLFFKRYKEQALHGKSFWSFCYTSLFVSPVSYLRAFYLALKFPKSDNIYIRDHKSLVGFYFGSLFTKAGYFFELHNYTFGKKKSSDVLYRRIMKRAEGIIACSEFTKRNWIDNGIPQEKIIVLPSGVNLEDLDGINKDKNQLRNELGLATDRKIITYSGALFENKGIEEILYCASRYENYLFLFIGGVQKQIKKYQSYIQSQFQRNLPNVIFTGHLKHDKIGLYLKASDILLAPYPKKGYTVYHLSSIKLIEYMASKVPVIASDLPSIREVFSEDQVTFVGPENSEDLYEKIKLVFDDYEKAKSKAAAAYQKIQDFSWTKRTEKIIDFLRN